MSFYKDILHEYANRYECRSVGEEEMTSNGFWVGDYARELSDDFFKELDANFVHDPTVMVFEKNELVGDIEISRFAKVDYENDVIEVGPKEVEPLKYVIDHDVSVTETVMRWALDVYVGEKVDTAFPYVLKASEETMFKRHTTSDHQMVSRAFMSNGYALYMPNDRDRDECIAYGKIIEEENGLQEEDVLRKKFIGFKDAGSLVNYVAFQFNPFTPMSQCDLLSIEYKGNVATGYYRHKKKRFVYSFDLDDKRYRVHATEWMRLLGVENPNMSKYDLVSDHDFAYMLGDVDNNIFDETIKHCFLEPLVTTREPQGIYSYIGPWEGTISRGLGQNVVLPYMRMTFNRRFKGRYVDITDRVTFDKVSKKYRFPPYCAKCIFDVNAKCECYKKKFKIGYVGDRKEVYYDSTTSRFMGKLRNGTVEFLKVEGKLNGHFFNGRFSLILPPNFYSVLDVANISKTYPELLDVSMRSLPLRTQVKVTNIPMAHLGITDYGDIYFKDDGYVYYQLSEVANIEHLKKTTLGDTVYRTKLKYQVDILDNLSRQKISYKQIIDLST